MKSACLLVVMVCVATGALAGTGDTGSFEGRLDNVANAWAHVTFEVRDKTVKAAEATQLASQADALAHQYPARAEPLVWEALATTTEAGARGGLAGLSL